MRKICISAFDSFGSNEINSTQQILENLPDTIGDFQIIKVLLPTVRYESFDLLIPYLDEVDAVISLGMANNRTKISLERVAINVDDFRIADNKGNQPIDEIIIENGPTAYFSNLPLRKIEQKLNEKHIPTEISNSAGTFVCNHLMYQVAHHVHNSLTFGFIHCPPLHVMSKETMTSAIEMAVLCL